MKKIIFGFLLILFVLGPACLSQNTPDDIRPALSIGALKEQLQKIIENAHVPGVSVAIVNQHGQEEVFGLGIADVASLRSVSAGTLFRI